MESKYKMVCSQAGQEHHKKNAVFFSQQVMWNHCAIEQSIRERKEGKCTVSPFSSPYFISRDIHLIPQLHLQLVLPDTLGHLLQKPNFMPHVGRIHHNSEVVRETIRFSKCLMVRLPEDDQPSLKVWPRASSDRR